LIGTTFEVATVVVHNQVPYLYASDGTTAESADLSTWVATNGWFLFEFKISAAGVELLINGVSRAALTTNIPSAVWQFVSGATGVAAANEFAITQYMNIWGTKT